MPAQERKLMPTGRPAGRPAKPIEQKILQGNPGKQSLPKSLPKSLTKTGHFAIPKPPVGLGKNGKAVWNQVWTAGQSWLNPESDYALIKLLCEAADDYQRKRDALNKGTVEEVYFMPNGSWANHPYVNNVKDLRIQMTAWLSQLGFSPTDRARLGITENNAESPFDELKRRREERKVSGDE